MNILKNRIYEIFIMVFVLAVSYFSFGKISTVYAQELNNVKDVIVENNFIMQNTIKLFCIIIIGIVIFGYVKGWRRAIFLGSFLLFLSLASIGFFAIGSWIAPKFNTASSKIKPIMMFLIVGGIYSRLLHKIYQLMNLFLNEHLK